MLAFAVTLSVIGLLLGPVLYAWGRGRQTPSIAIEGFTLGLVPAVVLLRLLPHIAEEIGLIALLLLVVGYGILFAVERLRHRALGRAGEVVALPALFIHAAADGTTLGIVLGQSASSASAPNGALLAAAVLIHRLPEGLFVARTLVPESGWRRTIAWLIALSAATCVGAALGDRLLSVAPSGLFHGVVAVGLGAMLRLATHTHSRTPTTRLGIGVFFGALAAGLGVHFAVPNASLHDFDTAPAKEPGWTLIAGWAGLAIVVGMGLWRFAPRAWLAKATFGPAHPCDDHHDHDHEEQVVDAPK